MKVMVFVFVFLFSGCLAIINPNLKSKPLHDDYVHNKCFEIRDDIEQYRQYCSPGINEQLCFTIQEYDRKCAGHLNERS